MINSVCHDLLFCCCWVDLSSFLLGGGVGGGMWGGGVRVEVGGGGPVIFCPWISPKLLGSTEVWAYLLLTVIKSVIFQTCGKFFAVCYSGYNYIYAWRVRRRTRLPVRIKTERARHVGRICCCSQSSVHISYHRQARRHICCCLWNRGYRLDWSGIRVTLSVINAVSSGQVRLACFSLWLRPLLCNDSHN